MAKGGSGFAASVWKARRSALNSAAPWPGPQVAQERVLGIQRKLHKWAGDDQDRRFTDLHNLVCDPATLMVAWQRVRANRGSRSAGVDRQNAYDVEQRLGVEQFLDGLREELRSGSFRPVSVRERLIPKRGGKLRRLGIPTVRDRVVQAALKLVLEPIFEADFQPCSYGFRPGRRAQDAIAEIHHLTSSPRNYGWIVEADIEACLEPSSHCLRVHGRGVEQPVVGRNPDSQALSAALADVDGLQLAALDTLQHGLAADAEGSHRVDDRDVAGGRLVDEQRAELVVDADPPRSAGGVLLAGDEPGLQPAKQRGGGDAELVGGLAHGEQLAVGWLDRRLVGGDASVAAQAADDDLGEPLAGGGAAALAVEDPGDRGVVVVRGEPGEQRDRVLVGADRGLRLGERNGELGDRAAPPADRDGRAALLALDVEDDFLDQAAQELLAVAVGCARRGPDAAEVGAERQQPLALLVGEGARPLLFAQRELGLGL